MAVYTLLEQGELQDICEIYGLTILSHRPISAGKQNSNYRIRTESGSCVLTLMEEATSAEVNELVRLLQHLRHHGYDTTRPLLTTDQKSAAVFRGRPVIVKEYVEGETVQDLTPDMLRQVGQSMAMLHRVPPYDHLSKRKHYGTRSYDRLRGANVDTDFRAWAGERRAAFVANRPRALPRGLVHGDVFSDNVLFEDGLLRAIIDFEEAIDAEFVLDLGIGIVGMCVQDDAIDMAKARALVQGYSQIRELEENEIEALQCFSEFAAALVACWRYWQLTFCSPEQGMKDAYLEMVRIAEAIRSTPPPEWEGLAS